MNRMSLETLLVLALATYRLSLLISKEAGPFDLMGRFRTFVGVKFDEHSRPYATGQVSEMVLCPFCLSVWIGFGVTLLLIGAMVAGVEKYLTYALLPFALSGLSVFFFKWTGV
jgi:hypothetical protein